MYTVYHIQYIDDTQPPCHSMSSGQSPNGPAAFPPSFFVSLSASAVMAAPARPTDITKASPAGFSH